METIDILTVIDPLGFEDNSYTLDTPISQIPMVPISILNTHVWMIAEHASVQSGQATWNLSIMASEGDTIRWWDTSVIQDTNEDMIIVGFSTGYNWQSVLEVPTSDTKACGVSYIKSGFDFNTLSKLKFAMNSYQNNFIQTKVKTGAAKSTRVQYYLVVAKLDTSHVGDPVLKGLYRFDPTITIV